MNHVIIIINYIIISIDMCFAIIMFIIVTRSIMIHNRINILIINHMNIMNIMYNVSTIVIMFEKNISLIKKYIYYCY